MENALFFTFVPITLFSASSYDSNLGGKNRPVPDVVKIVVNFFAKSKQYPIIDLYNLILLRIYKPAFVRVFVF